MKLRTSPKRKKPREFWLTRQNIGRRWCVAEVWHYDPSKEKWWDKKWSKPIHMREVLK